MPRPLAEEISKRFLKKEATTTVAWKMPESIKRRYADACKHGDETEIRRGLIEAISDYLGTVEKALARARVIECNGNLPFQSSGGTSSRDKGEMGND